MNLLPRNREDAQTLANEVGAAWYARDFMTGRKPIYFVTKNTPVEEEGEYVASGNAWSRTETEEVVRACNHAYALGLKNRSNHT